MESAQPPPRKGRARERYERRRSRGMVQPASGRSVPRQLKPAGGFELPKIPLPQSRMVLYTVGAVTCVVAVLVLLGLLKQEPVETGPNAIWIGTEWTYDKPDDETVNQLAGRLRENKIGAVYAWVSWLQEDGTWRGTVSFEAVKAFVQQFNTAYPEAELYGWVGFPVNVGDEDGYRLDNADLQQQVADFSQRVVTEFGFDGVFLNVEPVWNDDADDYLDLLRKVRAAVGNDHAISVAVPPDWSPTDAGIPVPPLIIPGTIWENEFKQRVALLADQIVLMAYNGGLSQAADYSEWVAYQVKTYAQALSDPVTGTQLIIGVPTYAAQLPGHDPQVENVETAIQGIRDGLAAAGDAAQIVQGVAIYAEWETDDTEWEQFNKEWVGS